MSSRLDPSRRTLLTMGVGASAASLTACNSATAPATGSSTASGTTAPPSPTPTSTPTASATPASTPPTPSPTGPAPKPTIAGGPGPDLTHGPRERNEVTLTFHSAGAADITRGVREALAAGGVQATFFAVGLWVRQDPSQVRSLHEDGHEIGNHTFNHLDLLGLGADTVRAEITRGREALAEAVGDPGWWFRPSGTSHSNETIRAVAAELGYGPCVGYDVDPEDFRDPGPDLVRSRTAAAVQPGSIVSLHLGHAGTVTALPGMLEDLASRGLRAVTLSTLFRD